ncbi:ABC transporter substrate-binding protein [Oceanobacillus chungangensis]|uniref:ABC transporter substrate-binding protein n=1 Tax=Oceanobacillus chungangensis TaxID=1229152 RepID=A0A3D8PX45_9BACI|nr:ABC transporter substrate-binding protein [Oceanobacillus chungangensis]RDW19709.1 ABC transporter substrate-binding protein [Oceanobacillus chungangensis]
MRIKNNRRKLITIILLMLCLSLSACSGMNEEDDSKTKTAEESDLSNTLIYAGESADTINPILNTHDELPNIIFSGLMKYDANGKPVVDLSESYEYDDEANTYTFKLRKGVKWHDGTDFTADDVVYTYEVLTKDKTLSASITSNYEDISSVTAPDDHTVVIKLSKYNAAMLDYFTMGIIPKHLLEGEDINTASFNQYPVGTGRYKFVDWDTAGGMITLERNEDYYEKVPNIERVIYKTVSVESTKATMLESGEADLAWLNANYAENFRDKDQFKNIDFQTADFRGMSMNLQSDYWKKNADSIGVLNYAINKQEIVDSVLKGRGFVAYSPIQLNAYGGNKAADIYPYDLDKFAKEMEALGWTKNKDGIYERDEEKFHFTIQVRDYEEERVDIANIVSTMLKKAGVDMEVVLVTKFDWEAGYNGFLYGSAAQFDPDMSYVGFVTNASGNTMHYSNPKVDELLKTGRSTSDENERKKIYGEFEVAYAEQPGIVLISYLDGNYVSISGLDGLDTTRVLGHHAVGVMWNIENWTLNK